MYTGHVWSRRQYCNGSSEDVRGHHEHGHQLRCRTRRGGGAPRSISKEACPAEADGSFIWVGLHAPDQELLRTVQQRFNLHDLAIEDALLAHQRPKLEIYGDSVFIALRTAQLVDKQDPVRRDAYLRRARLCGDGAPRLDHRLSRGARALRRRAEDAGDGRELRRLFDHRLHRRQLFPGAARLEAEADALEEEVFAHRSDQTDVERIYELRHELLLLRRAVQPLQEVCNRIMRYDVPLIDHAMNDYFRDIQDHVIRVVEGIDNLRDLLNRRAGSQPAAGLAGAEPGDQEADRLGGDPVDPAGDRVDLRHELQVDARARAALRLSDRDGGHDRAVRLPVLPLPARGLALAPRPALRRRPLPRTRATCGTCVRTTRRPSDCARGAR